MSFSQDTASLTNQTVQFLMPTSLTVSEHLTRTEQDLRALVPQYPINDSTWYESLIRLIALRKNKKCLNVKRVRMQHASPMMTQITVRHIHSFSLSSLSPKTRSDIYRYLIFKAQKLFIEGLLPRQQHRVISGLLTCLNITCLKFTDTSQGNTSLGRIVQQQ